MMSRQKETGAFRPTVITGPLAPLVEAAGGVNEAAEAWGVSTVSIWRWGTGRGVPIPALRKVIDAWAVRRGLKPVAWLSIFATARKRARRAS